MKIKQFKKQLKLNPARPYQETLVYIEYDNSDRRSRGRYYDSTPIGGRFLIKLPQVVADALGKTEVRAEDQNAVEEQFYKVIEQFKNMQTEVNKVILYSISLWPSKRKHDEYHSAAGQKVEIWAGTFIETVAIAGNGERRYSYERADSSLSFGNYPVNQHSGVRHDEQVAWTDASEKFFAWIAARMSELIEKLTELDDPDFLLETITAGRLLPFPQEKHE